MKSFCVCELKDRERKRKREKLPRKYETLTDKGLWIDRTLELEKGCHSPIPGSPCDSKFRGIIVGSSREDEKGFFCPFTFLY